MTVSTRLLIDSVREMAVLVDSSHALAHARAMSTLRRGTHDRV